MRSFRKLRFIWVYPLVVFGVLTARTSETSLRVGVLLALLGEVIRLWANGYVGHRKVNTAHAGLEAKKIGSLITAGPYAYMRNPLYVGTFLIGIGLCVAAQSVWGALGVVLFYALTYVPKVRQEEALILEEWGEAYAAYQRAVPRWVPTWRRYAHRNGTWSRQGIQASKELKTVLWLGVGLVGLYFHEEFLQEGELFAGASRLTHIVLALVLVACILTDGIAELRCRAGLPKR
ncbi:MAG: isoprenylcysteine carboxylmethyltransferase family protein [Candidatus Omnitrophica bacterium]|nr:isoprenylcysteine carboxylmethyltransferase family protein [Candidatus Omnitrophota bacterium]